ncbi:MAG: hydroxymethylbilane synthase [Caldisericaceae bacterium]|nr:hydroxymethylbilane synthase [Caldisericaceae bacterium]
MNKIRIGTRGSALALWQAQLIENELQKHYPNLKLERIIIKTKGDRDQKSSLTRIGGQGLFTKTIEEALLKNQIDLAVHSLKDLPSTMAEGLMLAVVPKRGPVEDVLVTPKGKKMNELPSGARIATGSIRRRCQLLQMRPDLQIEDLRGNIDTRLKKLHHLNLDGIIMALAAIRRLQISDIKFQVFDTCEMIPAIGQGAIGVQIRAEDQELFEKLQALNHRPSYLAALAERSLLRTLDTGCQFPVGGLAQVEDGQLTLSGFVGSSDGRQLVKDKVSGLAEQAEQLGVELAKKLLDRGAEQILKKFRSEHEIKK